MTEKVKAIISAIVILAANIAAMWGIQLDTNVWIDGLCAIVMLVATVWGIWKNHNFTPEAAEAQGVLNELKAERKEQVDE